jgi:serine/threonine protein kinase/tetratricopeptide (TPR) repeat protein
MNDLSVVESIFLTALEKGSPEERGLYLDAACGRDTELRRHVERLLNAHQNAGEFLQGPDPAQIATADAPSSGDERPGTVIGPYKLLEQIGEGGMGVVYVAEQHRPVRRKVALKIIKPGMDSRQVVARFEAERQALAMMDHPSIARVLDGGATDSGRPYFVMELVRGIPITDYCDHERLSIPERLELFLLVCRAVQHAHQKGVIHRDLKPSNILVTVIDGAAVPKVIDFGVAKATGASLTDRTLYTAFHQFVGTPLYMSPEQADLSGMDVDTRSDIYALGVLLYELLTGTTPFDQEAFRQAAFDEVWRIIREQETPTPSSRLSTLGETLTDVSAKRGSDPRRLGEVVRGELDWVVMKALEKDRNRRYETANGLAADVRRYLADEPVQACQPSAWYRLSKAARRNRVALVTSVVVATALVLGTVVSTWQAIRAMRAEREAAKALKVAEAQRAEAEAQRRLAEDHARQARRAVDEMYSQVAERWLAVEPQMQEVQKEFLRKAADFYREFTCQRATEPRARQEMSLAYNRLGKLLEFSRGEGEDLGEAERSFRQALAIQEELVASSPANAEYRRNLARICKDSGHMYSGQAQGVSLCRRAVSLMAGLMAEDPGNVEYPIEYASSSRVLALVLQQTRQVREAEWAARQAVDALEELGKKSPATAAKVDFQSLLAASLSKMGDTTRATDRRCAEEAYRRASLIFEKIAADKSNYHNIDFTHHNTDRFYSETCSALGDLLVAEGRLQEAEPWMRRAVDLMDAVVSWNPERRRDLAGTCLKMAWLLRAMGRPEEAKAYERRAREQLELAMSSLERREPPSLADRTKLAGLCNQFAWLLISHPELNLRDLERAVKLAGKAVESDPKSGACWNTLGVARYRADDWKAAVEALERSMELHAGRQESFDTFFLAMAHWRLGAQDEARTWYDRAVAWMDRNQPKNDELKRFRAEAAALLGLADLPDDVFAPP